MKIIKIVTGLLIGLLFIPADVFALRCGSDLVYIGDRKIEVFQKCGEPTLVEEWKIESTRFKAILDKKRSKGGATQREEYQEIKTEIIEEWTYNFGANRFIHFLTFTNGKLSRIEDGSRGFKGDFPKDFDKTRCGKLVEEEDRKIEVIMKCGEPVIVETRMEEKIRSSSRKNRVKGKLGSIDNSEEGYKGDKKVRVKPSLNFNEERIFVNVTEWSFNFGPHHFLQFITFENGKVIKSERGDYGYEENCRWLSRLKPSKIFRQHLCTKK